MNFAKKNIDLVNNDWKAKWITHPTISGKEIGLYFFKKLLLVEIEYKEFIVNISADNRYKLYVNGQAVCNGPARGDLLKWRFETVDLVPYLKIGTNIITVKVWNFAELRPMAQFSAQTGLIIQGNSIQEELMNTNQDWKVMKDEAYSFYPITGLVKYYVTGPGELLDTNKYAWDWMDASFEKGEWLPAKELGEGKTMKSIGTYGNIPSHSLYPSEIPLMESKKQFFQTIRKIEGINSASALLDINKELIVPANSTVSILLDQGVLTNAYTQLYFSKGKNAKIKITYAESLFEVDKKDDQEEITRRKGNRDTIEGKKMKGHYDIIVADGGDNRFYEPLWWRTFRYVELVINTQKEALCIQEFSSLFTAYPLIQESNFKANEPLLSKIFEVGWRTQRLCAVETFVDCPYYEQLQYIGDARVQGLVTFYVSGDTALWKKSITDFYDSRLPFGLTQSRYPSYDPQLIPTFSLVWVTMLWDYTKHCDKHSFIDTMLPAVLDILQWFKAKIAKNGLLTKVEGWNFVDWVESELWTAGATPLDEEGSSAILNLQYVYTIQKAVTLFKYFNKADLAREWEKLAVNMQKAILLEYWNKEKELIADNAKQQSFSQHANILAVLTNTIASEQQRAVIERICDDSNLAQSSYYFKFYLFEAIKKVGLGTLFLSQLSTWEAMLANGLTTFKEEPEPSRSDCHAWSSSPLYYFFSLICGIEPMDFGFNRVKIAPDFCGLNWIAGEFHHKKGKILVTLTKKATEQITGKIILPQGLEGTFYWNAHEIILSSGVNLIEL